MCQARPCVKCFTCIHSQLAHNEPGVNKGGIGQGEATELPQVTLALEELGFEPRQPSSSSHKIQLP